MMTVELNLTSMDGGKTDNMDGAFEFGIGPAEVQGQLVLAVETCGGVEADGKTYGYITVENIDEFRRTVLEAIDATQEHLLKRTN